METYTTKNYSTDGGDTLVIGGKLVFEDGAEIRNFPGAANQAASTATNAAGIVEDFNALLLKLKNAGVVAPDELEVTVANTVNDQAEANADRAYNTSKISGVEIDGTDIAITLTERVDDLKDFDGGGSWGIHKWLGIAVSAGITPITGLYFNGARLTEDDVSEATAVGLSEGSFVLWLKADRIIGGESDRFTLRADGCRETEYAVTIIEPAGE